MEISYHAVNLELWPEHRAQIERELGRIDAVVHHFPHLSYSVSIEHSPRKGGIGTSISVRLSTRTLFATGWGGDVRSSVEVAADKVVRQAKRHVEMLRRDSRAGSDSLRATGEAAPPPPADLDSVRDLEDFRDHVAEHAARLQKVLKRERRLDRRLRRQGSRISVPDLVEEAIAYVFEHFREKPRHLSPDRWLVRRGLLLLDQTLAVEEAGPGESTGVPAPDPEEEEEARQVWEELQDLEPSANDPLEGHPAEQDRAAPDAMRQRREAQRATAYALHQLPETIRRVLTLRHLEGYAAPEIAYVLNTTEEQVGRWLAEGETALRDRLKDFR